MYPLVPIDIKKVHVSGLVNILGSTNEVVHPYLSYEILHHQLPSHCRWRDSNLVTPWGTFDTLGPAG